VLARVIEAAGISTVLVTMMPYWSDKVGVPRTLGVEFPFGHPLGHAGDRGEQLAVIREALRVLREAREPGTVEYLEREWPDFETWKTAGTADTRHQGLRASAAAPGAGRTGPSRRVGGSVGHLREQRTRTPGVGLIAHDPERRPPTTLFTPQFSGGRRCLS
jgi:hypothetical protein